MEDVHSIKRQTHHRHSPSFTLTNNSLSYLNNSEYIVDRKNMNSSNTKSSVSTFAKGNDNQNIKSNHFFNNNKDNEHDPKQFLTRSSNLVSNIFINNLTISNNSMISKKEDIIDNLSINSINTINSINSFNPNPNRSNLSSRNLDISLKSNIMKIKNETEKTFSKISPSIRKPGIDLNHLMKNTKINPNINHNINNYRKQNYIGPKDTNTSIIISPIKKLSINTTSTNNTSDNKQTPSTPVTPKGTVHLIKNSMVCIENQPKLQGDEDLNIFSDNECDN